jgi:hypothetical protein
MKGQDMNCCANMGSCDVAPVFVVMFAGFVLMAVLVVAVVKTWIYCRIFSKAGYSWALGLLMLVPIANIIMPFVLALGDWPVQKELRLLKQQAGASKPQAN